MALIRRGGDREVTAKTVREKWDRGVKSTREQREQAAVNQMFLRNRHWVYWNKGQNRLEEMPRHPSRVRATVPRIGPDSRGILAKLLRRELVFDVPPSSPDDVAVRGSRIAEAALAQAHHEHDWEAVRSDHANCVWSDGVGGLCVEWDYTMGPKVATDDRGRQIGTGDVKLSTVSLNEMAFEPGTRNAEKSRWWIRGVAMPPAEVKETYGLAKEPNADARALDIVARHSISAESAEATPLTMVFTYYERPNNEHQGQVLTVVGDEIIDQSPWPFPFDDRLNVALAVVIPVHAAWYGHTPVTDAVPVQAAYNMSWSSIIEHMKLAGNARLWVPQGSVDDIEELSDTPGEAVEYVSINGMRPDYQSPPSMPDWWIRQPGMLEATMDDILGRHDVSRGEAPSGVESGIALSILSENDDTPTGALAKNIAEAWGRAASMALKLWETNVKDTRTSIVMYGGVPEPVRWTGGNLVGQTTARVPLDSVMPRSRAAQAAYALQLYDRKIIATPAELAKVADLPDQDDLLDGIDPDTARARRENHWLAVATPRTVMEFDDHGNHIKIHRDFVRSERYENLPPETQQMVLDHIEAHEIMAAQQAAMQTQAAMVNPVAASMPTGQTKPIPADDLQTAQALALAAGPPTGASMPAPPEAGPAPSPLPEGDMPT